MGGLPVGRYLSNGRLLMETIVIWEHYTPRGFEKGE